MRICHKISFTILICVSFSFNLSFFTKTFQHRQLVKYLEKYKDIQSKNGWPLITGVKELKPGCKHKQILILKKRLFITGEFQTSSLESDFFDLDLQNAVKQFQKTHNLEVSGIVDAKTLKELNVPVENRIHQLELNIERWRKFSDTLEDHYVFVNLAAYHLEVVENNKTVMKMKVIIGRHYRKTPVFSAEIKYVEFNPSWFIPPNITKNDVLPKIREDPSYITKNNLHVFDSGFRVDPRLVEWEKVDPENSPYKFVQPPAPTNPMGIVKFLLPNKYKIYLHDTPDKELFETASPTFSSGCIRLSKATELAKYLLKKDKNWKAEQIDSLIASPRTATVELSNPFKIHIQYFTAWVNNDGSIRFTPDIYKRDK